MKKNNCWEYKKCGREPNGSKVEEYGVCPAATEKRTDSLNCGKHGGRSCWAITGTFCKGEVQGSFASKFGNCVNCDFYKKVVQEEGEDYVSTIKILKCIY